MSGNGMTAIRRDAALYILVLALALGASTISYAAVGPDDPAPVVTASPTEIKAVAIAEAPGEAEKIDEAIIRDLTYAGTYTVTAYSADYACCGKYPDDPAYGITASGTTATEGTTVASDWDVLPPGTVIYIDGIGDRIVEDLGSGIDGTDLDLYFEDYDTALEFGVQKLDVWIVGEVKG
ncbi:3D domain-containing protein [Papillibacter cinnamivorans]|uniref:3D (Asp-Asp-Asp) domain-containing protein n=1 Tax=Papillibacter cinnamivorans DSM 12816 TaxID=1122930 RepID=A0A1W1YPK4_9FIRM|nr:3D domain-containing protein [Papillibacter cinnamivorans]SMC38140.1 3D (Asp-Asp-Asp) domain-containing protein [Papillibacter cinnamivorans DSM 12816]